MWKENEKEEKRRDNMRREEKRREEKRREEKRREEKRREEKRREEKRREEERRGETSLKRCMQAVMSELVVEMKRVSLRDQTQRCYWSSALILKHQNYVWNLLRLHRDSRETRDSPLSSETGGCTQLSAFISPAHILRRRQQTPFWKEYLGGSKMKA